MGLNLSTYHRQFTCGELNISHNNQHVTLSGWIAKIRDLGGVIFIDLRDRYGKTQVVLDPKNPKISENVWLLRNEWVIKISGKVKERPEESKNNSYSTGAIEIIADAVEVLNQSIPVPFVIDGNDEVNEDLRLKYRYLDLRREQLQRKMFVRSHITLSVRNYFNKLNFIEVETPVLMKSTPEGARDFLVPSRVHAGKFYALPQSPQTYKQLLMVSGFDRYFQIVKCFRDEDLRADRQPEFTQIDVEMSFIDQQDIQNVAEGLIAQLFQEILNVEVSLPLKRMTFAEAMSKYGSDKPDLRNPLTIEDVKFDSKTGFKPFDDAMENKWDIACIKIPLIPRNKLDEMTERYKSLGLSGLMYFKMTNSLEGSPVKAMSKESIDHFVQTLGLVKDETVIVAVGVGSKFRSIIGTLRLELGKFFNLTNENKFEFLWVNDFPLLEWDEEEKRYIAMHHPFTSPKDEDIDKMGVDNDQIKAKAYDLVLNGSEIAGGSIRIYKPELQAKMFELLGIGHEEAQEKFGFLMDAFKYGAPPHGGIAFGLDRLVMIMTNSQSIREVIAFPKNSNAVSLMDNSPSLVSEKQLKELYIKTVVKP